MSAPALDRPGAEAAGELTPAATTGSHLRDYLDRVRGGDIGALPALLGLAVLVLVFTVLRPVFFSPLNFANLLTQAAAITLIAMGLVFVLLLGEIDLSAGFTSGTCAAVLAILVTRQGLPWWVGVLGALLTGAVIGTALGTLVARVGIPSFVVTLAAFLALQGLVLVLLRQGENIRIADPVLVAVANRNVPPLASWALWAVAVGAYAALLVRRMLARRGRGLTAEPPAVVAARIAALALLTGAAVFVLNLERARNARITSLRGVPIVVPIVVLLLVLLTFLLARTTYGRHVYAVGGNAEAARRAGIDVARIRTSVFVLSSTMAAVGGIALASRANSVDPNTGGSNTLLYAVGAAVIGGTSLFGGKGRVRDAVLGALVIAVIDNGMGLLGYSAGLKLMITGVVLLLAAGVDALSRRRAAATGRA